MKKLKPIAYELINLKEELLNNNYSKTVKNALELSVDQFLHRGFIDLDMQLYLKDESLSLDKFIDYVKEVPSFAKTKEELSVEYDKLIEILNNNILNRDELDIYFKYDVEKENIMICKVFRLTEDFLRQFFYLKDDEDGLYLEKLMKRKGFIEKFAIFRLPRIFSNFIKLNEHHDNFVITKSYPYYDSNTNNYSIDLVFNVSSEYMEDEQTRINILNEVLSIAKDAENYFNEKMSI